MKSLEALPLAGMFAWIVFGAWSEPLRTSDFGTTQPRLAYGLAELSAQQFGGQATAVLFFLAGVLLLAILFGQQNEA